MTSCRSQRPVTRRRHWIRSSQALASTGFAWSLLSCAAPSAQVPEQLAIESYPQSTSAPVAPPQPGRVPGAQAEQRPSAGASGAAASSASPSTEASATDAPCAGDGLRARQRCEAQQAQRVANVGSDDGMARAVKPNERTLSPQQLALERLLARGKAALLREDYEAAVKVFRDARKQAPRSAAPLVGLVQARVGQLGLPSEYAGAPFDPKFKELLALLDEALSFEPDSGQAHLERGRLLLVAGDSDKARSSLLRAVNLLPTDAEAHSALAVVYLTKGNVSDALAGFKRASDLEPQSAERLTNLGTAFMMQGDVQQAISAYNRAVGLAPNDARSRGDLGTALLAVNDARSALPHLRRAQELAPARATFMSNLGYAYQRLEDQPAAEQWYRKAVEADPELASAWINLGTLQAAQQKYDAAETSFKKALDLDPEDPRAIANLAELRALR